MEKLKDFFSVSETAKILGISRIAVLKKITKEQVRATKVGRNYIITKDEVLRELGTVLGETSRENIDRIVKKPLNNMEMHLENLEKKNEKNRQNYR